MKKIMEVIFVLSLLLIGKESFAQAESAAIVSIVTSSVLSSSINDDYKKEKKQYVKLSPGEEKFWKYMLINYFGLVFLILYVIRKYNKKENEEFH